jgi:hypothetical protein
VRQLDRGVWSRENRRHCTPDYVPGFRMLDLGPDYIPGCVPGCILDCAGRIHLDHVDCFHPDFAWGVFHPAASVERNSLRVSTRIRDPGVRPLEQKNS